MWRLWAKLFGWKYVYFIYGFDGCVRRVRTLPDGKPYAMCYGDMIRPDDGSYRGWVPLN